MQAALEAATGLRLRGPPRGLSSGGGFASCQRWDSDAGPLFVKLAPVGRRAMLDAEADGLRELAAAGAIRVPAVIGTGTAEGRAFLVLEWIELQKGAAACESLLGAQLALQHRVQAERFGWHRDNTIGATLQRNSWTESWSRFFAEERLAFQLHLAESAGYSGSWLERGRRLCRELESLLDGHRPVPSLLHGDLWGGNWAADAAGRPVVFDPAVYYGDREVDLAMTRLFGGFGARFYRAYESAWPLEPGAERRRELYNLYHVINHLNLFGGGYRAQAEQLIDRLLRGL